MARQSTVEQAAKAERSERSFGAILSPSQKTFVCVETRLSVKLTVPPPRLNAERARWDLHQARLLTYLH